MGRDTNKIEEVLLEAHRRGIAIIPEKRDPLISDLLKFREKVALAVDKIDFGCEFDDNGVCSKMRKSNGGKKCCCNDCAARFGYFSQIPIEWIGALANAWDPATGFLGSDGCRLPASCRSSTCLSHRCLEARDQCYKSGEIGNNDFEEDIIAALHSCSL